jgi:hypothetical protein
VTDFSQTVYVSGGFALARGGLPCSHTRAQIAAEDSLAGYAAYRRNHSGERINIDVQVSVGYLHSGYPSQGPLEGAHGLADIVTLRADGNWGWMHEMGHQMQLRPDRAWGNANPYTFDNSIECTVNLFTTAAMDAMRTATRGGWDWTCCAVSTMQRVLAGFALQTSGVRYRLLDVSYKLAMWLQLRHSFGWAAIHSFLVEINAVQDSTPATLPTTDVAKRDWFLLHMSRATGYSLTQYVQGAWGLEVTQSAVDAVAALNLPSYLPAIGIVPDRVSTQRNTPLSIAVGVGLLSLDGVANVTAVSNGTHGWVTDGGAGTWVYRPASGYVGVDTVTYSVRSSSGYETVAAVRIDVLSDVVVNAPSSVHRRGPRDTASLEWERGFNWWRLLCDSGQFDHLSVTPWHGGNCGRLGRPFSAWSCAG